MDQPFKNESKKSINIEYIGFISFLIGVFLLASAVGIGIIFLFLSLLISFIKPSRVFNNKWNISFFISALLMFISTCIHFLNSSNYPDLNLDPKLSLLGLANWIPFFFCFCGFQKYLNTTRKRIITARLLICGSIPIIFSGILQLLNINGPFELFNGLIIWFQRPLSDVGSLSGLFNNPNYAGLWMVMVWPFCLWEIKKKETKLSNKLIISLICICFFWFITLTETRSAMIGLIISSPIVLGSSSLIWYLPIIFIGLSLFAFTVLPIFPEELRLFMKEIIPFKMYRLSPRISIWLAALVFIIEKPLFGWGAASFPILYSLKNEDWFGHSHNLPLELALSYGILPSLIIFTTIGALLFFSYRKISEAKSVTNDIRIFNKSWILATLSFLIAHLFDIQYFDVRISMLFWILIAGLKAFIQE